MGREIRRVSPEWQHPRDTRGNYRPLFDRTYVETLQEWREDRNAWQDEPKDDCSFEEWAGSSPDPDYYRPEWVEEPTCYQIYEPVSEGTPTSPIFASLDEMRIWLIEQGFSETATAKFVETGWAPSSVFIPDKGMSGMGIHSLDFLG